MPLIHSTNLFIGAVLVTVSVFLIVLRLIPKDAGVQLHEEWEETRTSINKSNAKKNYVIGILICFGAGYLISGRLLFAVIALAGAIPLANMLNKRIINKKKSIMEDQYTQVLNTIVTSLQGSSSNVYKVLEETVASLKSPAKEVFVEILHRTRTGTKHYEAIGAVAEETQWEDLRQLEMAFRLYDSTGSNLQQVCTHLLKNAFDRKGNKKYVEATTAQIRLTGIILSAIPFFLIVFMRFSAPEFIDPLFYTIEGGVTFGIITILVLTGNKIINNMMKTLSA
ncbi:MAG: hypothetical protein GX154_03990 [Clostridiales bacterium]|nr:hypothetical protein [Clostridiales bacterium]